jgi:hypothetical protein
METNDVGSLDEVNSRDGKSVGRGNDEGYQVFDTAEVCRKSRLVVVEMV